MWYLKCSLKKKNYGRTVFNATVPYIDNALFNMTPNETWQDFYPSAEGGIPHDCPEPRGKTAILVCYTDANHTGNLVTRHSH